MPGIFNFKKSINLGFFPSKRGFLRKGLSFKKNSCDHCGCAPYHYYWGKHDQKVCCTCKTLLEKRGENVEVMVYEDMSILSAF